VKIYFIQKQGKAVEMNRLGQPEEIYVKIYFIQKQGEEAETNRLLMDAHLKNLSHF